MIYFNYFLIKFYFKDNIGGGLFCGTQNTVQLAGVLSHGLACGVANNPGVFTLVSHFNDWINTQFTRQMRFLPGTGVGATGGVA